MRNSMVGAILSILIFIGCYTQDDIDQLEAELKIATSRLVDLQDSLSGYRSQIETCNLATERYAETLHATRARLDALAKIAKTADSHQVISSEVVMLPDQNPNEEERVLADFIVLENYLRARPRMVELREEMDKEYTSIIQKRDKYFQELIRKERKAHDQKIASLERALEQEKIENNRLEAKINKISTCFVSGTPDDLIDADILRINNRGSGQWITIRYNLDECPL